MSMELAALAQDRLVLSTHCIMRKEQTQKNGDWHR